MSDRSRALAAIFGTLFLLLVSYVGGYFALGFHWTGYSSVGLVHTREFPATAFCTAYRPMARLECRLRREMVILRSGNEIRPADMFPPP